MPRRRTKEDWADAVVRDPRLTNATKILLLRLPDHMNRDRIFSVPRSQLAHMLGRSERRVQGRLKEAVEVGYLVSVRPGYRGHTAEYQGTFPDPAPDRGKGDN